MQQSIGVGGFANNGTVVVGDATIVQFSDCALQFTIQQTFGCNGECRKIRSLLALLVLCTRGDKQTIDGFYFKW
jgi:hypothetical protein